MKRTVSPEIIRRAILDSLPRDVFTVDQPDLRFVYLPDSHIRALDPDSMLVVGARGTGKSFWWKALQDPLTRAIVSRSFPSRSHETLDVVAGWGKGSEPGEGAFADLRDFEPSVVWKTIVLERLAPEFFGSRTSWKSRAEQVKEEPEGVERRFSDMDSQLLKAGTRKLLLFDALDLVADTWKERSRLLKGLLKLLLDFRYTRSIRLKAFVRPDAIDDPTVREFPDASKVLHSKVVLDWPKIDLYGLFWQHVGNASDGGASIRSLIEGWGGNEDRWTLPKSLARDEETQRKLFVQLAGEKMGGGIKRGRPYVWLPGHLADARGQTTPRSFLAALRTAAEKTPQDCRLALDWRAIQEGVRKASEIRVDEIREDFAWMELVMKPLKGCSVPCEPKEVLDRWKKHNLVQTIQEKSKPDQVPLHFEEGHAGLLRALEQLGVLQQRTDDRINVPDLYRVHFGLKRKGGVPPAR
jgi:hypothetical protein